MKRNAKGQFVKGAGGGGGKKSKGKKSKGKKHHGGGGSMESRVSRLEHNQRLLVGVVDGLESRVTRVEHAVSKMAGAIGERFAAKKSRKKRKASAGI